MTEALAIPRPANEAARLAALHRYQLLDTPAEADFDFLTKMAATLCGTPYAYVSLVDAERVWYKSAHGSSVVETARDEDYCAWAVLDSGNLHIADLRADPRTAGLAITHGAPHYRMYSGAQLTDADGHCIGILCVLDVVARALSADTLALLNQLAAQVMALIELRAKSEQLERVCAAMERLATTDELTGLLNRRSLLGQLQHEIDRSRRSGAEFACVMIDIDHFKRINDGHGHQCGDAVLREIGALLRQRLRATDVAGRYGGEELMLLLVDTGRDDALRVAEELRAAIAAAVYSAQQVRASASFGVAVFRPAGDGSLGALVEAADQALYRAKRQGRNRVGMAD